MPKKSLAQLMRNISTSFEEKYQTYDGNVTVTNFKRGLWQVSPRGKMPFMAGSKREAFNQAIGIAARHWGLSKNVAFPKRSHATRRKLPDRYAIVETVDGDWMILIDGVQTGSKRDRSGAGSDTYPTHDAAYEAALQLAGGSSHSTKKPQAKRQVGYGLSAIDEDEWSWSVEELREGQTAWGVGSNVLADGVEYTKADAVAGIKKALASAGVDLKDAVRLPF